MGSKIVVKGYQVGSMIDQVGMRTLYRALHVASGKEMFLTVIKVRPGPSLNMLMRRAEMSKKLVLPGLVSAFHHGELSDNRFYYTHHAVPSFPVTRSIEQIQDPTQRFHAITAHMISALEMVDYIHTAGTTHRDLCTTNLRIAANGGLILEGFINARPKVEARNIAHMVNLPYLSPEQLISSHTADRKTDIYAMGVVLFELITKELPYPANYPKMEECKQGIVPSPSARVMDVPTELEAICLRALSPRGSRYRHCGEMITDLENFHNSRSFKSRLIDLSVSLKNLLLLRK